MIKKKVIKKKLLIDIELDNNNIPENIYWTSEKENIFKKPCKICFLYTWDEEKKILFRLDLWCKKTKIEDMKNFFYQSFLSMGKIYKKATNDKNMSLKIEKFSKNFLKNEK
ncbi:gliding motility protein GldC [Candidatus Shikimatogenerans silvanidophilus]|uniref:gliding motility protein GldC n=1 Tax=Candidatus Shikimatogenerans silvanidophilus TaxID=2782547 RepID=UPI001BAE28D9|nr:gliding motility protein GldC [Candidatus Shikimatogenerans silvanidophilus]